MVVAHWVGAGFLTAGSWVVMGFMMGFVLSPVKLNYEVYHKVVIDP